MQSWLMKSSVILCFLLFHIKGVHGLQCYSCDREITRDQCEKEANASDIVSCPKASSECSVWRFYSETDSRVYFFQRKCSVNNCAPGCTSLDDMEHRFISCYSCCKTDLCNTDNGAKRSRFISNNSLLILIIIFTNVFSFVGIQL